MYIKELIEMFVFSDYLVLVLFVYLVFIYFISRLIILKGNSHLFEISFTHKNRVTRDDKSGRQKEGDMVDARLAREY